MAHGPINGKGPYGMQIGPARGVYTAAVVTRHTRQMNNSGNFSFNA